MKTLAVFVTFLAVLQAVPLFHIIKEEWTPYKLTHRKQDENDEEEKFCMKIFMENCIKFAKYNQRYKLGSMTYNLDINKYVDMSNPDFVQTLKGFNRKYNLNADIRRAKEWSGGLTILNSAMPVVIADKLEKINNIHTNNMKRKKRFAFLDVLGALSATSALSVTSALSATSALNVTRALSVTSALDIIGVPEMKKEKNLIRTQIELNKEKIQAEKQYLRSLEIENKYKEEHEKIKVAMENIMLNKAKEKLKSLEIENKNKEIIEAIKLQIIKTILLEIEEARRSIILQKNRLERKIERLEYELNELENELYALKMKKTEENMNKIRHIEEKIENIEENIIKLGADIINYSRLSLAKNKK